MTTSVDKGDVLIKLENDHSKHPSAINRPLPLSSPSSSSSPAAESISIQSKLSSGLTSLSDLEFVTESPRDIEAKISKLERELHQLCKENEDLKREITKINTDKNVTCLSLTNEKEELRNQLKETATICQELVAKLEVKNDEKKQPVYQISRDLEAQIIRLKASLKDAVDANVRWQEYNHQREVYVDGIRRENADLKQTISHMQTRPQLSEKQQREIDQMMLNAKGRVNAVTEEKERVEDDLRECRRKCANLEKTVQDLNSKLSKPRGQSADPGEIDLMKEQIKACTEDFEAERSDREKAQSKVAELQRQLQQLRTQVANRNHHGFGYQSQHSGLLSRGCTYQAYPYHAQLPVNVFVDGEDVADTPDCVNIAELEFNDNLALKTENETTGYDVTGAVNEREEEMSNEKLNCPTCNKSFGACKEGHMDLVEHIDLCTE